MEIWYTTNRFKRASDNHITAQVEFPEGSPWFDGHFPQEPILPGIAQVAAAHELVCRACGKKLEIREISRVRFKRKISPGEKLTVTVLPVDDQENAYRFRIICRDGLACSGFLKAEFEKENDFNGV